MPVNSQQCRGAVGTFNSPFNHNNILNSVFRRKPNASSIACAYFAILINFCTFPLVISFYLIVLFRKNIKTINLLATKVLFIYMLSTCLFHVWSFLVRTKRSGDIEQNPGPKLNSCQSFSICHWNLNSISAHFIKLSLLRPYITIHKFDVVCLSETYLNASISNDDDSLEVPGYNLFRADHPSNTKRGGVCIYYRNSLALKILDIHYLQECINFQTMIGGKLCRFVPLYRSPNQSPDDFELFANNFELNIDAVTANNPFLTVVLRDFNVNSNLWFKGDKTSYERSKIDAITSLFGLQQLINEPTHLLADSSSCIDLIFTSQPNLVMESGVHSSLHPNCHHQITYAKFNLRLHYRPPYESEIRHYGKANADHIRKAIHEFPWERKFENNSVNEKVKIFSATTKKIY